MTDAPPWPGPFRRLPFETLPEAPRRPHTYFASEAHELTMDSEPFGRIKIHYRKTGKGPPLLLLHGLMTTSYSYRYVLESLGEHFELYVPDMPGCGRSDKPAASYGPRALATWIGELLRALGITGCAAVGNSLGGYLCMQLALMDNGAFSRLVNVHSPGVPELRLHALHTALRVPGVRAALARFVRRDPLRWAHKNVHYFDETLKSLEEAREYGAPLSTPEGVAAFVSYLADTVAPSEMARFVKLLEERRAAGRAFPIPLRLLYARQDPMVPPAVGEKLHRLVPDAELIWMRDTSHFAHVDSPERLVPLLLDFLR